MTLRGEKSLLIKTTLWNPLETTTAVMLNESRATRFQLR
jgi:hypothetical protein